MDIKNEKITSRDTDFAKWYTDVIKASKLATYSNTKGCIVYEPNGYAIWEKIQNEMDKMFKKTGHQNVYMPLLIPESLMNKEGELIKGFAPEVAWVTTGGSKRLEERMCIRPTSETVFSDYFATTVKSYRDLPLKYNQWCSVLRWEKETRPFLRGREFLWQEGHTVHETKKEAEEETLQMLNIYNDFFHNYLAIPSIIGKKTDKEKFAGACYTYTVEALMYNGIALQSATSHYFGQRFSKAYDIKFVGRDGKYDYAYQTSWGSTTRMIGALIMVHSDDYGLVLPPKIAPRQVVIIPIKDTEEVMKLAKELQDKLNNKDIVTYIDTSDKSAGFKFAEAEVNGIPLRIEIGPRDLDKGLVTLVRRDTREKQEVSITSDIISKVEELLDTIQDNLYQKALERRDSMTYVAHNLDDVKKIMDSQPGLVKAMWCGSAECELKMKEIKGTKSRCIPFENDQEHLDDKCVCCGKPAETMVIWGIQY